MPLKKDLLRIVLLSTVVVLLVIFVDRKDPPLNLLPTHEAEPTPRTTHGAMNVILISIDTLRADHLGCYGYHQTTSPNIDLLAQDSIVFKTTVAQAPSTLPSHASILSSLLPHQHGAWYASATALPPTVLTLAEVLQNHDYRTAAFTGGGQLAPEYGLNQGFDLYQVNRGDEDTQFAAEQALRWIAGGDGRPFFLFLHSYETHHPYTPKPELLRLFDGNYSGSLPSHISKALLEQINQRDIIISDADVDHILATYDAEIRSMDEAIGKLIRSLKEDHLYDRTMIVLTSDHG